MIRDTAAVAAARRARGGEQLRVYAHLSRRLLADEQLERYLSEIVEDLALADGQFCAGIAQPLVMHPARSLPETLGALRAAASGSSSPTSATNTTRPTSSRTASPNFGSHVEIVVGCDVDSGPGPASFVRPLRSRATSGSAVSAVAVETPAPARRRRRSGLRPRRRAPVRRTGACPLRLRRP